MQNSIADETSPDLQVADVVGLFAYSITDCLYACANAIRFQTQWDDGFAGCKGVTWQMEMATSNSSNFANCWLSKYQFSEGLFIFERNHLLRFRPAMTQANGDSQRMGRVRGFSVIRVLAQSWCRESDKRCC